MKESQTYDDVGNIHKSKDGKGNETTYSYDEFNRLESVENAKNEITRYTYDLYDNLLTQTDGKGNTQTYEYNTRNLPVKRIDHGGRSGSEGSYTYDGSKVESYTYYVNGLMNTKTDRNGNVFTYEYDSHQRLKTETCGGEVNSYTYDSNRNVLSSTNSEGTITRTYDELGRVLTKSVPSIGQTTFTYDIISGVGTGEVAEASTDPKGNITTKVYDRIGRLKKVADGDLVTGDITTYTYYGNGNRESVEYPDGSREEYTYYPDNALWTLTNKDRNSQVMDVYTYYYDSANNQTRKNEIVNGAAKGNTHYTYDLFNRLETVIEPDGKLTEYTYDAAGNRESEKVTVSAVVISNTTYSYNTQNRLYETNAELTDGINEKTIYSYDNNGNMIYQSTETTSPVVLGSSPEFGMFVAGMEDNEISRSLYIHEYNIWNQIVKTEVADKAIQYSYNADGYRSEKEVNGDTTRYLYEYEKVVLETDGQGSQAARNVYGMNLLIREAAGETLYYMYNGHSDVTALIDSSGNIAASYCYDAFGSIIEETGAIDNPIRYAGYQYDEETGLYYLNARYYDSKVARFLQEDTYRGRANDPLSLNLYTYCSNNPIIYWDPTGHWQQGDELLSAWAQDRIVELTDAYYFASTDEERASIHAQANAIRNNPGNLLSNIIHNKDNAGFVDAVDTAIETSERGYMTAGTWSSNSVKYKKSNMVVSASDEEIIKAYDLIEVLEDTATSVATIIRQKESLRGFNLDIGSRLSDYAIPIGYAKMTDIGTAMLYNKIIDGSLADTISKSLQNGIPTGSWYTDSLENRLSSNSYHKRVWNTEKFNRAKEYGSTLLDFIPLVDDVKMIIEIGSGKDYITGRDIEWGERGFNLFVGLFTVKGLTKVDDLVRSTKKMPSLNTRMGIEGAGKALKSVDDIVKSPQSLYGKSKADVSKILGDGWTEGAYGSSKTGWKFTKGDQSIFYHPGGGRHSGSYYGYSSAAKGKIKIVGPDYVPLPGDKATIINVK